MPVPRFVLALGLLLPLALAPSGASAQRYQPRVGAGFEALVAFPGQDILPEGLGVGVRTRVSVPVNRDLSVAGSVGFAGFVLGGQDEASYVFNPQLSAILSFPRRETVRYLLGGFGGYVPLGGGDGFDDPDGGPALHLGLGWAFPLSETSMFVEVVPALVVGADETTVVLPARVGVIF
jgi:hypothetical protein